MENRPAGGKEVNVEAGVVDVSLSRPWRAAAAAAAAAAACAAAWDDDEDSN